MLRERDDSQDFGVIVKRQKLEKPNNNGSVMVYKVEKWLQLIKSI